MARAGWMLVLLLGLLCSSTAARATKERALPVIVLVEMNPWRMVLGSDSPSFVLYDDGRVIFTRRVATEAPERVSAVLDRKEMDAFLQSLPLAAFATLKGGYSISRATDQPTNVLTVFREGQRKTVRIYGDLHDRQVDHLHPRRTLPPSLEEVCDRIIRFNHALARPWSPEKVELMISPHDVERASAIAWPRGWPGLRHPTTRPWGESSYSIYLDRKRFAQLDATVRAGRRDLFLLIDGKTWSVSVRYPFPNEKLWMK